MSLLDEENLIGLLGNITNLGFPSTYKPSNTGVDYSRTDTDKMSPEEYNRWFQGQGRVSRSYPVATALGGLRAAKFLRDSFLRRPIKPSPTTGPLALTDQREEPTDPPLLQGPFQPLMLPPSDDIPFDANMFEGIGDDRPNEPLPSDLYHDFATMTDEEIYQLGVNLDITNLDRQQSEDFLTGASVVRPNPDGGFMMVPNPEYWANAAAGGARAEMEAYGEMDDYLDGMTGEEILNMNDPYYVPGLTPEQTIEYWTNGENIGKINTGLSNDQFYTKPTGYYSALEKRARGEKLSQQEQASAMREINYRTMASDTRNEDNLDYSRPVPNINNKESLQNFMDENPLEFTVRHSSDEYGTGEFDTATHLYFGGTKPNEGSRRHFYSDGRPAQAFIRYKQDNTAPEEFRIAEVQNEMRGKGNAYEKQVITKLAQQTLVDWADELIAVPTIRVPTGEAIFDFYGGILRPEEQELLEIKDEVEFYWKAREFYDGVFHHTEPNLFEKIHNEIEHLEKVKKDYLGKVKHYRDYTKELHKALKQHGAILGEPDSTQSNTYIKIKNPKEVRDNLLKKGFPIAMNTRKFKRQVA